MADMCPAEILCANIIDGEWSRHRYDAARISTASTDENSLPADPRAE